MKKRLLCLGLLLVMAFSFAACGYGSKGYKERLFEGLYRPGSADDVEALVTSKEELDEFREAVQIQESISFGDDHKGSRKTVYTQYTDRLDSYSSKYFENNVLIVIFRTAASGADRLSVKSVDKGETVVSVTLQYQQAPSGAAVIELWGILIECEKGTFSELNVTMETVELQPDVSGTGFIFGLTEEATRDTLFHDFTPEDFPELDFKFTIEDMSPAGTEYTRKKILGDPVDHEMKIDWEHYHRMFEVKLNAKNKKNVLRAAELLRQREDVSFVTPSTN